MTQPSITRTGRTLPPNTVCTTEDNQRREDFLREELERTFQPTNRYIGRKMERHMPENKKNSTNETQNKNTRQSGLEETQQPDNKPHSWRDLENN
eukprot:5007067-Amphidinium_carterae.2